MYLTTLLLLWLPSLTDLAEGQRSLVIEARPHVTFIGGPLLVEVDLINRSPRGMTFAYWADEAPKLLVPQAPWKRRLSVTDEGGNATTVTLSPYTKLTVLTSLHNQYEITPSEAEITVAWPIHKMIKKRASRADHGPLFAYPTTTFKVHVLPKTPKRVANFLESLQQCWAEGTAAQREWVYRSILDTDTPELTPMALQLADAEPNYRNSMLMWLRQTLDTTAWSQIAHARLDRDAPDRPTEWLSCWCCGSETKPPTAADYERFKRYPQPLTRLTAWLFFPEGFTATETKALLADAARLKVPLTPVELREHLRALDDNHGRQRDRAELRLRQLRERALAPLQAVDVRPYSEEVRTRIARVVVELSSAEPDHDEVRFLCLLDLLRNQPGPASLIDALAKNPDCFLTRAAKTMQSGKPFSSHVDGRLRK